MQFVLDLIHSMLKLVICHNRQPYNLSLYSLYWGAINETLNRADMQSLDFCVNRLLMKLFCTNKLSMIEECRCYFNIALPSELLRKRTVKFLRKLNDHRDYG